MEENQALRDERLAREGRAEAMLVGCAPQVEGRGEKLWVQKWWSEWSTRAQALGNRGYPAATGEKKQCLGFIVTTWCYAGMGKQ